ncbi:MAG: DNA polymerase III subunit gamma/tau [Pseudomonadales bacterium]|nr:DNA polymerase III subunit gamma/tau [Pseudomonadales bacterium]
MTYQVLARKWRPRSFNEMAGQGHVLKTLINSLNNNRLHHAYLFTGTRGVGKTTIARILARCLNCEAGASSEPCGHCGACKEIDEGRFIDLIEVDAASRTKVEDTRELLENVQYSPSRGRYKVYLIDEVHMLSTHSFNALLKTLEEPPPHVKFLLATTDPQKLPVTILSRCLQFNLKNLSPERLVEHLTFILEQEKISYEEAALWQLARAAWGSVRDALTLLDQAIAYCDDKVSGAAVRELLGTIDQETIHKLVDALVVQDAKSVLEVVAATAEHAPDFQTVLEDLLSYFHRVAIAQVLPDGIDNSQGDRDSVIAHARALTAENVQLYYQIALKGREELPLAVDPRSGLEMTLLRMLAFTADGVPNSPSVPLPSATDDKHQQKKKSVVPEPPGLDLPVAETPGGAEAVPDETASEEAAVSSVTLETLTPLTWISLFPKLNVSGITRNIAANCELLAFARDTVTLRLEEVQSSVYNEEHKRRIQAALSEYFAQPLTLQIEIGETGSETPAAHRKREAEERQQAAIRTFENDVNVREIIARFAGSIQPESIEALVPGKTERQSTGCRQ